MLKISNNKNVLKTIDIDVLTLFILETASIVNFLRGFQHKIDLKNNELNIYLRKYQNKDINRSVTEKYLNP